LAEAAPELDEAREGDFVVRREVEQLAVELLGARPRFGPRRGDARRAKEQTPPSLELLGPIFEQVGRRVEHPGDAFGELRGLRRGFERDRRGFVSWSARQSR